MMHVWSMSALLLALSLTSTNAVVVRTNGRVGQVINGAPATPEAKAALEKTFGKEDGAWKNVDEVFKQMSNGFDAFKDFPSQSTFDALNDFPTQSTGWEKLDRRQLRSNE